ncbi:hypothetical protein Q5752_005489 [Cryptotrichosporon argae]
MFNRNALPKQLQAGRSSANTRCQKCLKLGHATYECKNARPYVSRPSRTAQLAAGVRARERPSVDVPDEFRANAGVGLADRILKAKEDERVRLRARAERRAGRRKSKRDSPSDSDSGSSSSSSGSDSDSDSDSASDSSRSPRRRRRYSSSPPRSPLRRSRKRYSSASDSEPERAPRRSRSPEPRTRRYSSDEDAAGPSGTRARSGSASAARVRD